MKLNVKLIKVIAAALFLIAVIFVANFSLRGTNITVPALFQPFPKERLFMSMDGFMCVQSENGNIAWRVNSRSADLYENKEAQLKDIEIDFQSPGKDNKEDKLFGDQGMMDTTSGNATIVGETRDVKILTSDGYLLTTHSLSWQAGERLIRTSEPFKLLGEEIYLEGVGFSANVDIRSVQVKNNVKAVLQE